MNKEIADDLYRVKIHLIFARGMGLRYRSSLSVIYNVILSPHPAILRIKLVFWSKYQKKFKNFYFIK